MRPLITKPYRVTTSIRSVHVMATSFSAAMFTAKELYPGETILSVLHDPDWDVEVGHD
jgi:hypothetical protein